MRKHFYDNRVVGKWDKLSEEVVNAENIKKFKNV